MMKRPRGAAVSGEIRVREEEKFEGNKRWKASQIQRTPLVGLWLHRIAQRRIATGSERRPRNRRPNSPVILGLLVCILQAFESILNVSDEQKLPQKKAGTRSWVALRSVSFTLLIFNASS